MMMTDGNLEQVVARLAERNLSGAVTAMEAFLSVHPRQADADRLYAVRADFELMADYWKRGYKDPQLPALYATLLKRMYVLYANIARSYGIGHSSFLSSVFMRIHMTARDWAPQNVREEMEGYVAELALLELEPEHKREAGRRDLCRRHQMAMNVLFDHVWTSETWTDGYAEAMEELLLSTTVDANDQQLIVSAVTLSLLNHFDMAKFRLLVHVYRQTTDERVRQRALVGWVLSLHGDYAPAVYAEEVALVEELLEDTACCRELVELQQQIVFCQNAEKDHQTIQQEIMPDLLRNQSFRVTRNGIEEVEEDPMEDILHPDEQERKMEQTEESFRRMIDMQKQGSDIYFGGFSQMKRFAFFNETANWFVPFYIDHPDIAQAVGPHRYNRFLQLMTEQGPFCNSDKYSFVFAFQRVFDQLPQSMREMLERGEASVNELSSEEAESPAFIRRSYLQDLYRFFRLFSRRQDFFDPFSQDACYLFFADPVFTKTHLEPYFMDIVKFLLKQQRPEEAGRVLGNCGEARRDFRFYLMAGYLSQRHHYTFADEPELDALYCYGKAVELEPENEKALVGYARALFAESRYDEALQVYDRLLLIQPDKKGYLLNRAVCLTNLGRYAAALKDLYRMNYESPDDDNINRVLAWTLTCDGKYEQAEKLYGGLLAATDVEPDDLLNYGYCLWFSGSVDEAADCFHRYLKETQMEDTPTFIIDNERALLAEKGITEPEMQMMLCVI